MADVAFSPTHSIILNVSKSVTANFVAGVKITVNKNGQGTVSPGTGIYPAGGTKTFTATPAPGWRWSHWEGNLDGADGNDPSLDLPMDQSRTITAHFVEQVTLTMVKELIGNLPAEGGSVSPAVGETLHDKDAVVDLVATPDGGWRLKQWSGGGTSGDNPTIQITMDGDKTVTATFIQVHTVTTEVIEQGVIEPEGGTYDHGASQSFFFDRQSGHQFHHWAGLPDSFSTPAWGPGTSTSNPVNVTIEQSLHIIGYDDEIIYTLNADVAAEGCTGCTVDPPVAEYIAGTPGSVTATPGAGWGFVRWEGNVPAEMVEDNPLIMPMNGDKAVTAVMKEEFQLTIEKIGQGTVDPDVGTYTYLDGETATLSATAADDWAFSHWSGLSETDYPDGPAGPGTSSEIPLNLVMVRDETITANFVSGCMVMWPPGGTSGSALTAVSELEPEAEAELVSITFTSDLPVLHDDDGTFGNVGALFSGPEWTWGEPSHPILCAMDSTLTASVAIIVSPAGIPFTLIGEGPDGWSTFEGTGVATGEQQSIAVAAQAALPHALAKYNPSIEWRVEFCTTPQDMVSTEHTIYSTYGLPNVPEISPWDWNNTEKATIKRIEFLIDAVEAGDIDDYGSVGAAIAGAIGGTFNILDGDTLAWPTGIILWGILDGEIQRFECVSGRSLAVSGITMLGIPERMLRWRDCDGCAAYPSTDHESGEGYNSNCTDVEEPNDYCNLSYICGNDPDPHPDHVHPDRGPVTGTSHASGACPHLDFPMALRFGGGDGGPSGAKGSPAENFFKIEDLDGDWFYISVVPASDAIPGLIVIGDELDKAGRYNMMKHSQGNGYGGQHWFDNRFPAPPLP